MDTAGRKKYEENVFPHLESLWQTALWLSMRDSVAEDLVLRTVTRGYREWQDAGDIVNGKARLFRILTREFFGFGEQRKKRLRSLPFHPDKTGAATGTEGRNTRNIMPTIRPSHLQLLAKIPDVAVKAAIARLEPHSRLMLILLYRERFSYAEIVYITDLPEGTIKAMLTRIRRLMPGYVLESADRLRETVGNRPTVETRGRKSNHKREYSPISRRPVYALAYATNASIERWENEGGVVVSKKRR